MVHNHIIQRFYYALVFILFLFSRAKSADSLPDKQSADALHFTHFNVVNGLSNNEVHCILQDRRGFIWIGTNDGLNRFDGSEFIVFKNDPSDLRSVSGNRITALAEDHNGILWIGTGDGGICSFDPLINRFQQYNTNADSADAFLSNYIDAISIDIQNRVWAGIDKGGVYILDRSSKKFNLFPKSFRSVYHTTIYSIRSEKNGDMYFGAVGNRVYKLTNDSLKHYTLADPSWFYPNGVFPYPAHTVNVMFRDSENRLWLGAWDNALHLLNEETLDVTDYVIEEGKPLSYSDDEIFSINEESKNRLWIGTRYSGLFLFDPQTKKFSQYKHNRLDEHSLSNNTIRCIIKDTEGRMWLGTDDGIDLYDPLLQQFEVHYLPGKSPSPKDFKVTDFLQDADGIFYVTSTDGLFARKPGETVFTEKKLLYQNQPFSIYKIYRDQNNSLLLGTNKTLLIYDPADNSIRAEYDFAEDYLALHFRNLEATRINSLEEGYLDNNPVLWCSIYGWGLAIFDPRTHYGNLNVIGGGSESENLLRKIYKDHKNKLWFLGASNGIYSDVSNKSFTPADSMWQLNPSFSNRIKESLIGPFNGSHYRQRAGKKFTLLCNDVYDMVDNDDGTYWITTFGGGLYLFNPGDTVKTFIHIPSQNQAMEGIVKDNNGNLWIIASGGIDFFDTKKKTFARFDYHNGIPSHGISGYFYKDRMGYLYAGGNGFYIRFQPETIEHNKSSPPVVITHLKIFGNSADSLLLQESIYLRHDENFLSFAFAALNYSNPDVNRFIYQLDGFDKNPIESNAPFATYTNLDPGHYTFKIKAANNDGLWNESWTTVQFTIATPFWQTWWFISLCAILFAGFIYGLYRYRINQILKLHSMRNKIARDLHDEIGSTLGSISMYSEVAQQKLRQHSQEAAMEVLEKIGDNSRTMVDNIGDIVWAVNPANDTFDRMMERMNSFAAQILTACDINYHMEIEEHFRNSKLNMEQRKNLFMIFKESIYNILKYANCRNVYLHCYKRGKTIVMEIRDDGEGFNTAMVKSYNGNGIKNMHARAEEIHARFELTSEDKKGTTIRLIFASV